MEERERFPTVRGKTSPVLLYACPYQEKKGRVNMKKSRQGGPVRDIAVDLGTATTLIAVRGRGILLREPSIAAVDRHTGKVLAAGREARRLMERDTDRVLVLRPLGAGIVRDLNLTEAMLELFLRQVLPGRMLKPRILIGVPTGISQAGERSLVEAGSRAGAGKVWLMEAPLAAALGAGLDPEEPKGRLVVDVGGGVTDIAVIGLGKVIASDCLTTAGDAFDRALIRFVREEHGVLIGRRSAEMIKFSAGRLSGDEGDGEETVSVNGRCLTTGLPRGVSLSPAESARALDPVAQGLTQAVLELLERTPAQLAADIRTEGILLTGGGSKLCGLDGLLAEKTGFPVVRAEDPEGAVVLGLEKSLPALSRRQAGVLDLARRRTVAGEDWTE